MSRAALNATYLTRTRSNLLSAAKICRMGEKMIGIRFKLLAVGVLILGLAACSTDATSELEATAAGDNVARFFDASQGNHFHLVLPTSFNFGNVNGAAFESNLGRDAAGNGGTKPLYACTTGSDDFVSPDPNCEGQQAQRRDLQQIGVAEAGDFSVFTSGGSGRVPLYRCVVTGVGDHFLTNDSGCEGQTKEALLGYLLAP